MRRRTRESFTGERLPAESAGMFLSTDLMTTGGLFVLMVALINAGEGHDEVVDLLTSNCIAPTLAITAMILTLDGLIWFRSPESGYTS